MILLQAYDFDDDPINPNYGHPDRGALPATHYLQSLLMNTLSIA